MANAASILAHVRVALAGGAGAVVLDLADVTLMDSAALNALIQSLRLCSETGVSLTVANPSHGVLGIPQLTGLANEFGIGAVD